MVKDTYLNLIIKQKSKLYKVLYPGLKLDIIIDDSNTRVAFIVKNKNIGEFSKGFSVKSESTSKQILSYFKSLEKSLERTALYFFLGTIKKKRNILDYLK